MAFLTLICFISLLLSTASLIPVAPESALVSHLPGFNGTFPSNHYSGYVTIDESHGKNLFYYFVESEGNPAEDPLVLWLNGGPGCSSFDGFVYEHGPFNFKSGGEAESLPELLLNPYSWSKVSSIIYLDSPAGVGLSYSADKSDYITGDLKTASDSHKFLLKWFELYPEFIANPFYLSGESYAGVYVPTLAAEVAEGIKGGINPTINFKGYMVGNGVTDTVYDGNALVPFAHGMGLISDDLFKSDEVATLWLNNEAVRSAIHAQPKSVTGPWVICTDNIDFNHDAGSMIKYHKNLTVQGYRALIFSGDHDMCVPFTGTQAWTRSLGYKITDKWRPWYVRDQVSGFTQGYDKNLTFLTVKGSGHTVPEYKPQEAFAFYSRWLAGVAF